MKKHGPKNLISDLLPATCVLLYHFWNIQIILGLVNWTVKKLRMFLCFHISRLCSAWHLFLFCKTLGFPQSPTAHNEYWMHLNLVIAFALHYEVFNCGEYVNSEKIRGTSFISNIRSKKLPENVFQNLLTFWRKNKIKQHSPMYAMMKLKNCLRYIFWCTKQSNLFWFDCFNMPYSTKMVSKCVLSWSFFSKLCCTLLSLFSFTSDSTLMPHRWISAIFWFFQVLDENYLSHVLLSGLTLHWKGATTLTPKKLIKVARVFNCSFTFN